MVIEKILKELTPERVKKEIEEIQSIKLPPELQKWVKEYKKVGEREDFIWKWAYQTAQTIMLYRVPSSRQGFLIRIKFLMIMFIVLLDDVSDKIKNKKLLEEILKIPFEKKYIRIQQLDDREKKYLKFTIKLWQFIEKSLSRCPYHYRVKSILNYDIRQILNGIRYAYLVNKNLYLTNEIEFQIYLSHNTPAIISYMFDISCIPKFDRETMGLIRKIGWYIQMMARISNWISTWKREVRENDFASGMFCYAIENKIINVSDLQKNNERQIVKKISKSKAEKYLLEKWEECFNDLNNLIKIKNDRIINGKEFLKVTEKLTILHLISKGFI